MFKHIITFLCTLCATAAMAQYPSGDGLGNNVVKEKKNIPNSTSDNEMDLIDIGTRLLDLKDNREMDTTEIEQDKIRISALPAAGYTLQTGFAAIAFANATFLTTKKKETNISNVLTSVTYSQYNQVLFPIQSNIWTAGNKYNIVTDWRFLKYPSYTYGLGGNTSLDDAYTIDYSSVRLNQKILRKVAKDLYAGAGYALDYFWNVREVDPPVGKPTDFETYGLTKTSLSSGVLLNVLYDNRKTSVNPEKGLYASALYRNNMTGLGSDANWQSLQLDIRDYIKMPGKSVLAFWTFDWFTLDGNPPYLMLPNTGGDPYSNTGRGYIQGRYRAKNMLYVESEYRFNLTKDGLFGAVIFANAESFSEQQSNRFETVAPGFGGGLRIKLNKYSKTNIAIDYGIGVGGSSGFFVNLGEVF